MVLLGFLRADIRADFEQKCWCPICGSDFRKAGELKAHFRKTSTSRTTRQCNLKPVICANALRSLQGPAIEEAAIIDIPYESPTVRANQKNWKGVSTKGNQGSACARRLPCYIKYCAVEGEDTRQRRHEGLWWQSSLSMVWYLMRTCYLSQKFFLP